MTVKEAIKEIIKLKGLDIFNDFKIFNAMLLDFGNSNQKELNIFKNAIDEKILKFCIDNTLENNQKIAKIKIWLEDKGFSDKTIDFVIDSFAFAFGWNYMKMQQILNQTDWTCSCGTVNTGNFCSNCGKSKPVPKESSDWTCSCGTINLGNFCSNCGKSKPVPKESSDWTCSCGTVNTGNFCSNCGNKKGEQQLQNQQIQKQEEYIDVTLDETVLKQLGYDVEYENKGAGSFGQETYLRKNWQDIINLDIPATYNYKGKNYKITQIGDFVFSNCSSLTSVTIPCSVIQIGEESFCNCSSLIRVIIPYGVIQIGESAFYSCKSLTSVTIPSSVKEIGQMSFCDCSSLKSVTISNSLIRIGDYAFSGCESLTSVTIPNNVKEIGQRSFSDCSSLTSVTIPSSVTKIGVGSFEGCSSLTSLTIPDSVIEIDDFAFKNVQHIEYYGTATYNVNDFGDFGDFFGINGGKYWGAKSMN